MARFAVGASTMIFFAVLVVGCAPLAEPPSSQSVEPKTLESATAAAQEWSDRRRADDYAGMWLMFSKQIRNGISQQDYVRLSETCASVLQAMPVTVIGVRMDGDDRAIVRLKALDILVQVNVAYEDGKWALPPDSKFAAELGKPVDEIIAERRASGRCGDRESSLSTTSTATTATTSVRPTLPAREQETSLPPVSPSRDSGSCSVDDPGCARYDECHPVVTGAVDCFPENESCSKPGNNFPWCTPPTSVTGPARVRSAPR